MKIEEFEAYWRFCMHFWQACQEIFIRYQEIRWVELRFFRVSAHYPDPENPRDYMNVIKTLTTLNDGQQQPIDDFAPRANLKRLRGRLHGGFQPGMKFQPGKSG
jgi:hypothetical protein